MIIGTCSFFRSLTVDRFSDSLGKVFNCLMLSVSTAAILNVYLSLFGSLNYFGGSLCLKCMGPLD